MPCSLYRYNCTHKNESYCQYTFLYKDDPSLGLMDVVMDKSSVLCPVIVKPDYLGWALGIYHSVVSSGLGKLSNGPPSSCLPIF